jgi:hypothetical protein
MRVEVKDFTFGAMNLWSMPRLYIVELITEFKEGKKHTKTIIKRNPYYEMRRNG